MSLMHHAVLPHAWINTPNNPAPDHLAWVVAELVDMPGQQVKLSVNARQAATIGRLLMDWANKADPGAALSAVKSLSNADGSR